MLIFQRTKHYLKNSFIYDVVQFFRLEKEYWAWRASGRIGIIPHRVKQKAVRRYVARYSISTLVETGTYLGFMVNAVKRNLEQIYSIELDEDLYKRAKNKFVRFRHIHFFRGDSAQVLPGVLDRIHEPCLFWLDAHYSGGITAKGDLETPIVQELRQILSHPLVSHHVILIDDARNFVGANDYPTLQQVKSLTRTICPSSEMIVKDDIIRIHPSDSFSE
jgi:hypothetical protein